MAVLITHSFQGIWKSLTALAVASHHTALVFFFGFMQAVFAAGVYGVSIFFVVSGFCIHLSYRRSQDAGWAVFFTRRVFRIYPAYLVSLAFFILVLPLTRWSWSAYQAVPVATATDLLLHLGLIHNFLPQNFVTINIPYWSLAIEFQLYLLFPLLLVMTRKIGWQQTLIVTTMVEVVTRLTLLVVSYHAGHLFPATWFGWNKLSPFGFWFSWSLGAALAEAFVEKKPLPFAKGPLPLWLWPVLVLIVDQIPFLNTFAFPVAAFATARFLSSMLAVDEATEEAKPGLVVRSLNFLGITSYSIYLLHHPLYHYLIDFVPETHGQAGGFVFKFLCVIPAMAIVLLASYLLFLFVETPGINLGKAVVRSLRR